MRATSSTPNFAALVQDFFCQRLIQQQNASGRTVASYRDTFRLLLGFLERNRKKQPVALTLADLDAPTIAAFLAHLEKKRHNSIRTRNTYFAAVRSFLKYAATCDPAALATV
jgi:integrase/recombinase XerD